MGFRYIDLRYPLGYCAPGLRIRALTQCPGLRFCFRLPRPHPFGLQVVYFQEASVPSCNRSGYLSAFRVIRVSMGAGLLLLTGSQLSRVKADDWLPISQEELRMTSEPKAPGAAAIILYRQVDRDDVGSKETNYLRMKILTEEGRKIRRLRDPDGFPG